MELYKIGTENGIKVYKKTRIGNIAFIIICILLSLSGVLFGTTCYYRAKYVRLVERNRVELELARERADVLTDTITRAREEAGAIRESLSRQRTSVSELRSLIGEIRTRYKAMEDILNSSGIDYSNTDSNDYSVDSNSSK